MRTLGMLVATSVLLLVPPSSAASTALVLELADPAPVGVRVDIATDGACTANDIAIYEGVLKPGASVAVSSTAVTFCVRRALEPHTETRWSAPVLVHRRLDGAPLPVRIRSEKGADPMIHIGKPLALSLTGSEHIGVQVAAGSTGPCNATGNAPLVKTVLEPGQPLTIETSATCVCISQTRAPYVTTNWTKGEVHCRPMKCVNKDCRMDLNAPFEVSLSSHAP